MPISLADTFVHRRGRRQRFGENDDRAPAEFSKSKDISSAAVAQSRINVNRVIGSTPDDLNRHRPDRLSEIDEAA